MLKLLRELILKSHTSIFTPLRKGRYKKIDYTIYSSSKGLVLFILGSNEGLDWFTNLLGFIAFPFLGYHLGYLIKARHLKKLIDREFNDTPFILLGHSYGAAIVSVYRARYRNLPIMDSIIYTISFGCPVCQSLINFHRLTFIKNRYINLNKKDDFTAYTSILWPFKWAGRLYMLPEWKDRKNIGHTKTAYYQALKQIESINFIGY